MFISMIIVLATIIIMISIGAFVVHAHTKKKYMFSDYETKAPNNSWRPNGDKITPLSQKQIDARKVLGT